MSKLEKALEMAQQAHDDNAERPEKKPEAPSAAAQKEKQAPHRQRGHIEPVYTETRVAHADKGTLEKHGILTTEFHPAIVEQYNLLRVKVETAMDERKARSLMICSPGPREGKTVTAVNLAISIARETSRTVLLVDADMRKPAINRYMGLKDTPGLYEHLTKGVPLNELLINPGIPRLTILTAGVPGDYPADLLGGPAMQDFVSDIKSRYPERLIIFDSPPLNLFSDGLYLARYADAAIMVVRSCTTKEEEITQAMEETVDTFIIGTVLNRVPKQYCQSYDYQGY